MTRILKEHKKHIAVACAAILLCSFLAALYFSHRNSAGSRGEIPPGRIYDAGDFGSDIMAHDSAGGEIVIGADFTGDGAEAVPLAAAPLKTVSDPEAIWSGDAYAGNHTLVEMAQMKNGSIGVLTVPKLNLSVNVYESADSMEAMSKGAAHFPATSAYDGNVGLSAHNINLDGSDGYFKYLYTLAKGDSITYQTALGERAYTVESVTAITASDWTPLYYTDDNRLTMITCVSGQADKRLCVTALEQAAA